MNTLKIVTDLTPSSPRDWDNLGTISFLNSADLIGDEENFDDLTEFLSELANVDEETVEIWCEKLDCYADDEIIINRLWKKIHKNYFILPVYIYDHSGISFSTTPFNCSFDSGMAGFIYTSKGKVRKYFNVKRISLKLKNNVENWLKGEIETYQQYVNGEVYGYQLENEDEDLIDSCYGFYQMIDIIDTVDPDYQLVEILDEKPITKEEFIKRFSK